MYHFFILLLDSLTNISLFLHSVFYYMDHLLFRSNDEEEDDDDEEEEESLSTDEIFIMNQQEKFDTFIKHSLESNENVSYLFYDKEQYDNTMSVENNALETKWRTCILMQNTEYGNVIMYYDAYKQGFAYYSDVSITDIKLLNAIIQKYVMTYKCRDFYIGEEFVSPFVSIHGGEETNTNTNVNEIKKKQVFAKLKNYKLDDTKIATKTIIQKRINKLIHLGKIVNFSFVQKMKKTKREAYIQKENMSFSEYKNLFLK